MKKVYQVFVDTLNFSWNGEQRALIRGFIEKGCLPVGMDNIYALDDKEESWVKSQLENSDYYVLFIGEQAGQDTLKRMEYIDQTLNDAKSKNLPILIFAYKGESCFKFISEESNITLRVRMQEIKKKIWEEAFVQYWDTREELFDKALVGVWKYVEEQPQVGWIRGDCVGRQVLLEEIKKLQLEKKLLLSHITELEEQMASMSKEVVIGENKGTSKLGRLQIFGTYKEDKQGVVFNWKEMIDLERLFALWGPFLLDSQKDAAAKTRLLEIISKEYHYGMKYVFEIDDKAYHQLKVHLVREKLVKNFEVEAHGGGVTEFLKMTEKGKRLLSN